MGHKPYLSGSVYHHDPNPPISCTKKLLPCIPEFIATIVALAVHMGESVGEIQNHNVAVALSEILRLYVVMMVSSVMKLFEARKGLLSRGGKEGLLDNCVQP